MFQAKCPVNTVLSGLEADTTYQRGCFHIRNRYLVDNCDLLIAIFNGEGKGGTAYTVNYAMKQGKEIVILNPNTLTREVIPARTTGQ